MTKETCYSDSAEEQFCIQSSELDITHSRCQAVPSSQNTSATINSNWYHNSGSKFDATSISSSSSRNIQAFSLPVVYLFHHVLAGSETAGAKFKPVVSSFIEHCNSSQNSSVNSSSATHSALSSSTSSTITSSYPDSENLSSTDIKSTNVQRSTISEQIQLPLHIRPHIHREGEFICGWGAAFINICITFPINKTMFRQQLHGISGLSAVNQLRKDGPRFLYRGLLPPLLQKSSSLSVMFGMYYKCQDVLLERVPKINIYMNHTLAALLAGTVEAIFTPFERIQALMQTREFHNKFSNTLDAFYNLQKYGLKEYYRGFSAIILRNGPSNVVFFLGREHLHLYDRQSCTNGEKVALDFFSGACLGAVISTCFFPLNVVKIRMQCVLGVPYTGMWTTLKTVVAERNGFSGIYKGVHLNYMRSFISWGIINASYEFLMQTFFIKE
uniref:Solute carrier family 25 member 51 n=1 Tax=Arion vulgaris TaxID=1028688 RepID=A0A0B6ZMY9_9EUPU